MQTQFSPEALADLQEIGDHIALDSPANSIDFVNRLIDRCLDISLAPEGYVARPELGENSRSVAFQKYLIFYAVETSVVRIQRIMHGSKDFTHDTFQ